jgi:hypothetical protein
VPPRYTVGVRGTDGTLKALFDSWSDAGGGLQYTKTLDNIGSYSFAISMDDTRRQFFVKDAFIEIRRSVTDKGLASYTDFVGLHRDVQESVDQDGRRLFISKGPDLNHLLKRGIIGFFTDDPLASQNTFADDAMKNFVDQNIGPSASAPPRYKDHIFPSLSIEALVGASPIWSGSRGFQNLADVVHEIAIASLTDYQITLDAWSPLSMTFRTYYPYLGLDRSQSGHSAGTTPAIFSLTANNMSNPQLTVNSTDEITSVLVLGQGSQDNRVYEVVLDDGTPPTDGHINDSPWNDIEDSFSQPQDGIVESLTQAGLYELQHKSTKQDVTFTVLNSSQLVYGRDYNFGDLVTVTFDTLIGAQFDTRITGVAISVAAGQESTQPTFSDVT